MHEIYYAKICRHENFLVYSMHSGILHWTIDNEYYVTGMGNTFTVLIEMYSVTSSNLKPCVLNVNEFFYAEQLGKRAL